MCRIKDRGVSQLGEDGIKLVCRREVLLSSYFYCPEFYPYTLAINYRIIQSSNPTIFLTCCTRNMRQ